MVYIIILFVLSTLSIATGKTLGENNHAFCGCTVCIIGLILRIIAIVQIAIYVVNIVKQ